ncbi:glycoside hydrolase family 47 protein [Lactarius akahatsu]|uniref:alpha-1,2-Mannosidase n=1 Tax=Lactarius akahatsu TaxID=416441 RepID=A0AAD4QBT3_9AGAM|nr:glycoside hydrolase family 47 protein [Lactarius akahatsu]
MKVTPTFFSTFLFLPFAARAAQVQDPGLKLPYDTTQDLADVVKIFTDSYSTYHEYAFGHDEVAPSSKKPLDPRNGWGATIVDAMSTMKIMNLTTQLSEALNFVRDVDFSKSNTLDTVSVFESTIRYIGGLLSAYELNGQGDQFLVDKAKQLADKLSAAWVQENKIPYGFVDFNTSLPVKAISSIAEAGTLTLEWARLSKYTGDDKYRRLAEGAARTIASNPAPLPGLPAQGINPSTGEPVGRYITWGGGSDSYFEYLIKYAYLSNTDDKAFADAWFTAVDSSIRYLKKTSTVGDHVYLADIDDNGSVRLVGSHLACFHAGNWMLGGKLLNNQTIVDVALQLNDACWNTYAGDATGIGPEAFAYTTSGCSIFGTANGVPTNQQQFYCQHGYYITSSGYIQRPEVLESNFYAWRITGDQKYLDRARSAVKSFNTYLKISTGGFAGIREVNNRRTAKDDETQSFWFAEVLKYLYLTFDDPSHISLNDYVFNTEAHPFKLPAPPAERTLGSGQLQPSTTDKFVYKPGSAPQPSPKSNVVGDILNGVTTRRRRMSKIRAGHRAHSH